MSELIKLKQEYDEHMDKVYRKALAVYFTKLGIVQEECKHEKTHWIQEIATDGSLSTELRKRCYVCGLTVDTLNLDKDALEAILIAYDKNIEFEKEIRTPIKAHG